MQVLSHEMISNVNGNVKAVVVLEMKIDETSEPVRHKRIVEVLVKPSAPQGRINRKLAAKAKAETQAYFDGEDAEHPNMFSDISDTTASTLSIDAEIELEQELLAIEQEFCLAA